MGNRDKRGREKKKPKRQEIKQSSTPGRVGSWRGGAEGLRGPVSSPRHITRSVRVSRTTRSCTLRDKGYEAYRIEAATQDGDW
jgi:hypothetical protein